MNNHFADDHPAAPTFTPPELPKRVHVRGITGKKNMLLLKDFLIFTITFLLNN
jgi:hypothetical protein